MLEEFTARSKDCGWFAVHRSGWESGLFTVCCQYDNSKQALAKGLMTLIADIVVQENPIYQHSSKLQDMAHDLRKTPLFATGLKGLARFLKHNNALHIDGYVAFRMTDYREKLDIMSYTLIKKLKFNQQD